jgi:uncharacterized membrane protein YcgQ (UPF0703/DUF1980 family)
MNYQEAKRLAQAWTQGVDVSLEGWRSVMSLLLNRIDELEGNKIKTIADIIKDTQDKSSW